MQPNPKIFRKIASVRCLRQERQVTPEHLLQTHMTFDLRQFSNSAHGSVKTRVNGPDFYRCWSEDQWHILPWGASDSKATTCHAWNLWRVLYLSARQCSCFLLTEHARHSQSAFWNETPAFISPDLWPPNSTDLNPVDYKTRGKCSSGSSKFMTSMNWSSAWSMSGSLSSKASSMTQLMSQLMSDAMSLCMNLCERETFWAINLTPVMPMLFCKTCLFWYCVKCSRISLVSIFYILQDSAATHLKCGGKYGIGFVANFLENTTVK